MKPVLLIFTSCIPFKVSYRVIMLVAVFMVHLWLIIIVFNESCSHKPMNGKLFKFPIPNWQINTDIRTCFLRDKPVPFFVINVSIRICIISCVIRYF